jgi:RNA polymerase sigma-32 factor
MNFTDSGMTSSYQYALAKGAPHLDLTEEQALARRFNEQGDRQAGEALVRANLRTVTSLATKYRRYRVPLADLVAEGNCGLAHALGKYDPERGVRFATYAAHWVRAYMLAHVLRSFSVVSDSSGAMRSQIFFKLRRERARLRSQLGDGEACVQALAERLNLTPERVRSMLERLDAPDVSLDRPRFGDGTSTLLDQLATGSDPEQALTESTIRGAVGKAMSEALSCLDARERYVVERRLLADSSEELSLAEIGRLFGVSRERARQIELRAKRKLKARVTLAAGPALAEWLSS